MGYKKACFNCKKSYNRPIDFGTERKYPCPDCGKSMVLLNHKFRPPKKTETKKWKLIEFLANNGFIFQSIFETTSGGTCIPYPKNLREAKEFILKYKEQSITWGKQLNPISVSIILQPKEIINLLKEHTSVTIELSEIGYNIEYFYGLVSKLTNCLVKEIRPIQTIIIEKDVESSYLFVHKEDLLEAIKEYSERRTNVFKEFCNYLNIEITESVFSDTLKEMRKTIKFNKGTFKDWKFWQHGGDIEFKNKRTDEHLNVLMYNREALAPWSLIQFLNANKEYNLLVKSISNNVDRLKRLMDMLVIDGSLLDNENELRMKIITLKK